MNKDEEIAGKKRILSTLKRIKSEEYVNLTVTELTNKLESEIAIYDLETDEKEANVVKEFTDSYLIKKDSDGFFGSEKIVMHIEELEIDSYDTEWTRLYILQGERFGFNKHMYSGRLENKHLSEEQLRNVWTRITKDEYLEHVRKYEEILDLINKSID
jgi:hypothetical protein